MDMTPQTWPEWYDGRHINEVLFCQQFLDKYPMKCVRGRLFTELVDRGRRSSVFVAFGDSARCTLAARRVDAVIAADGTLRVETRRYEAKDLTAVVCDDATAARLLPQLPCAELDVLTATAAAP